MRHPFAAAVATAAFVVAATGAGCNDLRSDSGGSQDAATGDDGAVQNDAGAAQDGRVTPRDGSVAINDSAAPDAKTDGGAALLKAVQLSGGRDHMCALIDDGTVRCWGSPLPSGSDSSSSSIGINQVMKAPATPLANIVEIVAGRFHTCALSNDGLVYCWGQNNYGELGNGTASTSSALARSVIGPNNAVLSGFGLAGKPNQLAAGDHNTCANSPTNGLYCWGEREEIADGIGKTNAVYPTVVVAPGSAQNPDRLGPSLAVALGESHGMAVDSQGRVIGWGSNNWGRAGIGDSDLYFDRPQLTGFPQASKVVAGYRHSCILVGTGVQCFGISSEGALGNGVAGTVNQRTAVVVVRDSLGGSPVSDALQLAGSNNHNCVVTGDSTVRCWGRNADAQLGDGSVDNRPYAVTVVADSSTSPKPFKNVRALGLAYSTSCAILIDGSVYCWGSNGRGLLGNDAPENKDSSRIPVHVKWF